MNDIEKDEGIKPESSIKQEKKRKKPEKQVKKTQNQMVQEALGLSPIEIKDIEKKLFIVRFLDYFAEETLDFIFKDSSLGHYIVQMTAHIGSFGKGREEDKLLKQSFQSKNIIDIIKGLKKRAEDLALDKGIKGSIDKRLRKLTLIITIPLFVGILVLTFLPIQLFFLIPLLCGLCLVPQLIRTGIVKKWLEFKEQNKNQIYAESRGDIMILKDFASELLDNIRARLLELKVPLELIKFVLHSRDYENLRLLNQKRFRGSIQYFYTFEYPPGFEPFPLPQSIQQLQKPDVIEKRKTEKLEKNFIVLTELKGKDGVITNFIPTLKYALAEKINQMLNESEFEKARKKFSEIIPNYSENMAIYCVCGEIVNIINVQVCNWRNQFKFYLFEGEGCKCGEKVYGLSLMDEFGEVPEELKDIFIS